jgi:hypothetical protein
MRLFGAADWRPTMPEGTENYRVTPAMLPTNPTPPAKTVVAEPEKPKQVCPPGFVTRATGIGCIAAPKKK